MSDESAVRMEDLLAHRQWVRSLARRLAADESSADDLEQATWLAAIEHPPRDARSPRGWLSTVLRNLHRNKARDASRRGRREEAVARPETTETAADLVAEAETQTLLVREVLALEEPYRSTVLLRWFEDLSAEEVAQRQGVPLETVRTRLKRAVARLRERMDERHGGDRRAWCVLLLGSGYERWTGTATGTTAATLAAGGVAMGAATKLAIAAVALLAIGSGVWWMQASTPSEGAAAAKGPETAPASVAPAPPKPRDHAAATTVEPAPSAGPDADFAKADRDLDLHGIVVRADGTPVAGAKLQAVDYPWRRTMTADIAAMYEEHLGATTTTSAAGTFALRLRRGEATSIRVSADGLASVEKGPHQAGERVTITMRPAVTLRVAVKDEGGAPVAGATLWLMGFGNRGGAWINTRSTTEAAGTCVFAGLPAGESAVLLPWAGAGDFGMQRVTFAASGESTVDVVSPTGRTIRGRVFDAVTLAPVTDATVGLGKGWILGMKTDGGGRFEIRGFTGKGEKNVYVRAKGYASSGLQIESQDDFEMALRPGVVVTGRVVDGDGGALAAVFVAVQGSRRERSLELTCCGRSVSDADGRFRIEDLDRTMPLVLSAQVAGRGRVRRPLLEARDATVTFDVGDVVLGAPRAIEGRVLKTDGSPSPGASVRLTGPGAGDMGRMWEAGAQEERRTDDLGRFRFADLSPGEYAVETDVQRGTPLSARVTLTADRDLTDVVLPPKPPADAIVVVVVKDESGAPLAGINVNGSGGRPAFARTDTDGRAALVAPDGGKISRIDVGSQDVEAAYLRSPSIRVEPGRTEYTVSLVKGARLACRLLDADGAPVARATVDVEPGDRAVALSMTDTDGRVRVTLPRDGEYSLVFTGGVYVGNNGLPTDSLLEARQDHVTAQSGEVVLRCRRVETGRTAVVRLLAADGSPVADIEVRISASANVERKVKTDAEGRARFDDLPAHEFHASAFRPGSLMPAPARFVPEGQEVVLRYPAAVSISGTAVQPDGAAAPGAFVMVMRGESGVFTTTADASGRFTVQVPAGDEGPFKLTVSARVGRAVFAGERAFLPQDRDLRIELTRP